MSKSYYLVVAEVENKTELNLFNENRQGISEYDLPDPKQFLGTDEPVLVDGAIVENHYITPQAIIDIKKRLLMAQRLDKNLITQIKASFSTTSVGAVAEQLGRFLHDNAGKYAICVGVG